MRLGDLAALLGVRFLGDADVDGAIDIERVRSVDEADVYDLGFVAHAHDRRVAFRSRAGALLVDEDFAAEHAHELPCPLLVASVPSVALRLAIEALHPITHQPPLRAPAAVVVAVSAVIGADVVLGAGVVIEDDVVVGDGCVVGPNVVLRHGVCLGLRVRVGPGTIIGDNGFVFDDDGVPLRPVASVVIGDDVWLGANVAVDRGLLRDTRIGARGRIDNLVQVGHDVVIGANVVIVAQVGIAGWVTIGDGVTIAGQAGVNPHVRIASGVRVGGQAGVTNDVDTDGAVVAGTPAFAHHEWLKSMARLKHLDATERRLRRLERTVALLTASVSPPIPALPTTKDSP